MRTPRYRRIAPVILIEAYNVSASWPQDDSWSTIRTTETITCFAAKRPCSKSDLNVSIKFKQNKRNLSIEGISPLTHWFLTDPWGRRPRIVRGIPYQLLCQLWSAASKRDHDIQTSTKYCTTVRKTILPESLKIKNGHKQRSRCHMEPCIRHRTHQMSSAPRSRLPTWWIDIARKDMQLIGITMHSCFVYALCR